MNTTAKIILLDANGAELASKEYRYGSRLVEIMESLATRLTNGYIFRVGGQVFDSTQVAKLQAVTSSTVTTCAVAASQPWTSARVNAVVDDISASNDSEGMHSRIDALMEAVLNAIANGNCDDPQAVAQACQRAYALDFDRWYA